MDPTAPSEAAADLPHRSTGRGAPPAKSGGQTSRSEEPKRRRPTALERRYAGFGDGLERASCAARPHRNPEGFPVQRRQGVATLAIRVVARRSDALLLCDGSHPGPHRWPNGDEPTEAELASAPESG